MSINCLVVQSGGATSVINNTLCGLIEEALKAKEINKIYGARQGIHGLLQGDYVDLGTLSAEILSGLRKTPGIALGSWRHKLKDEHIDQIVTHLKAFEIDFVFYIGGNGSMHVANLIYENASSRGMKINVLGIPKTIDNDIMHTHHTPGFGSAAKFLGTSVIEAGLDIQSLWANNKITILETMGRNTGWLASSCALARQNGLAVPHHIYIPESPFSIEKFLKDVQTAYEKHGHALVVVSEGIRDQQGRIIGEDPSSKDAVGRPSVGGGSAYLTNIIEKNTSFSARYVAPSIWQRTGMHVSSKRDADEAYLLGKEAIRLSLKGISGMMMTLKEPKEHSIQFGMVPLTDVAGKERLFPIKWYDAEQSFVTREFIDYATPLIQGELFIDMKNGLPVYQNILSL